MGRICFFADSAMVVAQVDQLGNNLGRLVKFEWQFTLYDGGYSHLLE